MIDTRVLIPALNVWVGRTIDELFVIPENPPLKTELEDWNENYYKFTILIPKHIKIKTRSE